MLEQRCWRLAEEAFCRARSIGAADEIIVHGGQRGEFAIAQAMLAVVMEGELSVAPFHAGTAALEQVGAFGGERLDLAAPIGVESLQW